MGHPLPPPAVSDAVERGPRRGYPEAIYCEHKSPDQVRHIAERVGERPDVTTIHGRTIT